MSDDKTKPCPHTRVAIEAINGSAPKVIGHPYWHSCCLACGERRVLYVVDLRDPGEVTYEQDGEDPTVWRRLTHGERFKLAGHPVRMADDEYREFLEEMAAKSGITVEELKRREPLL